MLYFLLVGCFSLSPTPGADDPVGAVLTEGGSHARETVDGTKIKADLAVIRTQLKLYVQTHEGEKAPDLDAIGLSGLSFPDRYSYDAAAGVVTDPEHSSW